MATPAIGESPRGPNRDGAKRAALPGAARFEAAVFTEPVKLRLTLSTASANLYSFAIAASSAGAEIPRAIA